MLATNINQRIGLKMIFAGLMLLPSLSWGAFVSYNGGAAALCHNDSAAGTTVLENFESYGIGTQINSLPALGVGFETLAGGGHPNIYLHSADVTPYGRRHLGNFPNGINAINRFDDIVLTV